MIIFYSLKVYNLTNGAHINLLKIKENTELSFYISATMYQKAISTIFVNNNVSPFSIIATCSYKSLNSNFISKLNKFLVFKQKLNQLVYTNGYSASNNDTNYIGLHFVTNQNISYLSITINLGLMLIIYSWYF